MTYTLPRYRSYQDYLDDEQLYGEKDYRLLSTGEVIEVASEDELNRIIAYTLIEAFLKAYGVSFIRRIRRGDKELQVQPVGDRWVNRKPDLMVMQPEHLEITRKAIFFDMPAPAFVAEVVSPGSKSSISYQRDYVWKRQQYEWWQIPEYWIIDPHRGQIMVLTLANKTYQEAIYQGGDEIISAAFPLLHLSVDALLTKPS